MSLELGFDEPFFLSQRTSNIHLGPPGKAILPGLGTEFLNIFGDELRFLSDLGCFRVFALWKGQTGCFFPNMPWLVVFVFLNGRQRMRTPPSFPHHKLRRGLRGGAGVFAVAVPQPTFAPPKRWRCGTEFWQLPLRKVKIGVVKWVTPWPTPMVKMVVQLEM